MECIPFVISIRYIKERKRLSFEWWIGRGKPFNPYLKGRKVFYLLKELKPKEVRLFPEQLVFDGEREILERNVVYQWMRQWFTWLSWYHTISSNPDPSLDQFFDAPICATSWKRQDFESNIYILAKVYDMGVAWSLQTCPSYVLDDKTVVTLDPRWSEWARLHDGTSGLTNTGLSVKLA
ncbi:hypothetical protein S83_070276 [Arachis hypogaea]